MTYKERNDVIYNNREKQRRKCRCGHFITITNCRRNKNRKGYFLCTWCGGRVYYDPLQQLEHDHKCEREEFRLRLVKNIRKMEAKHGYNRKRIKRGS